MRMTCGSIGCTAASLLTIARYDKTARRCASGAICRRQAKTACGTAGGRATNPRSAGIQRRRLVSSMFRYTTRRFVGATFPRKLIHRQHARAFGARGERKSGPGFGTGKRSPSPIPPFRVAPLSGPFAGPKTGVTKLVIFGTQCAPRRVPPAFRAASDGSKRDDVWKRPRRNFQRRAHRRSH